MRFFFSEESGRVNCSKCYKDTKESLGCVANHFIKTEENDDFYIYYPDVLGLDRTPFIYDDIACYVCPRCCIQDEAWELISLYSLCKQLGQLPMDGGLYDQSAVLVEAS